MSEIDYQALRAAAAEEIMLRSVCDTSDNWQDLATPEAVIVLVETLEADKEQVKTLESRNRRLEGIITAAENRIAELEEIATDYGMKFQRAQDAAKYAALMHSDKLRNRVSELEASHRKLRDVLATIHNTIRMDGGYTPLAAILNAAKRAHEESAIAAGVAVEGEPEHWKILNELNGIIGIYNDRESAERKAAEWRTNRIIPLYAAPPAPVVPKEMNLARAQKTVGFNRYIRAGYVDGWNACRAAMLHGAEPVSQTYKLNELSGNSPVTPDGWISCSERMPNEEDVLVYCSDTKEQMVGFHKGKGLFQFFYMNGVEGVCEPSHWMPLPEPPQEAK
ncbi:TPA: DUF551 domain-containing protein [Escherichia coli]